jgi:hypothetical protein
MSMTTSNTAYDQLFEDALADVEKGVKHSCNLSRDCREARGCGRCIAGVMRGDIGILAIDIYRSGTLRLTTLHDGKPCTVAFRNVKVTVHD